MSGIRLKNFSTFRALPFICAFAAPCALLTAAAGAGTPSTAATGADAAAQTALDSALAFAMEPPFLDTSPGPEYADAARDYNMVIGMDRTPRGRLWAAWVSGGDSEDGYFVAATSDDDGKTWSAPRLVIDPPEAPCGLKRRILVGNLWTDPRGRLWLFFDQSMGYFDGRAGSWAALCENPDSDAPRWSAPRRLWHGATLNKPVILSNGDWLLPVSLWPRGVIRSEAKWKTPEKIPGFTGLFRELDASRMAHWFASSDQGKTWARRGGVPVPATRFDEHTLVELKDGRLWMLARTRDGLAGSFSADLGATWSAPRPSAIKHVKGGSRVFFRRLASGAILLVKNGKINEQLPARSHLTALISRDEGATWGDGLLLDERDGVSYPDGFQAPDGSIYIIYDRERAREREILYAKFTEADIGAGAFISKASRRAGIVSKATGNMKQQQ